MTETGLGAFLRALLTGRVGEPELPAVEAGSGEVIESERAPAHRASDDFEGAVE